MKKFWDLYTNKIGHTILHPQFLILKDINNAIKIAASKRSTVVVDLGAGDQRYKNKIEENNNKYIPVDLKKPINKDVSDHIVADISKKIPLKNSFADTVTLFQVLQYIADPKKTFKEIYRILKKGGRVIATSPFMYPIHDKPHDRIRHTKENLIVLFKESGFRNIKIVSNNSFIAFLGLSINIYMIRLIYQLIARHHVHKIFGVSFLPLVIILCVLINIAVYLYEKINQKPKSEFPVNYTIEATK